MPYRENALFSCERLYISLDRQDVIAVGELDLATGPHLTSVLSEAQTYARYVGLDLSRLTFMDANGAHILLAARAHAHATSATFAITSSSPPVKRLLELVGAASTLAAPPTFPPSEQERVTVRVPTPPRRPVIGRPRSFAIRHHGHSTSSRTT